MKKLISTIIAAAVALSLIPSTVFAGGWEIPQVYAPWHGQVLTDFPREAEIKWTGPDDASFYEIEIACDVCVSSQEKWLNPTSYYSYTKSFVTPPLAGDNEFRVRVRGYHEDLFFYSSWSDYSYFNFSTSSYNDPVAYGDNYYFETFNPWSDTSYYLDVLYNDEYDNFNNLYIDITADPVHGSVYVNNDLTVIYTPDYGHTGYDDFEYKLTDGYNSSYAWVSIDIDDLSYIEPPYIEPPYYYEPPAGYEYEVPEYEYQINPFTDIDPSDPEGAAAINLYHEAIIGGYPDGTFKPYNYVNRAETAKFISNVLWGGNVPDYDSYDNHGLYDLKEDQWYFDYVVATLYDGIFEGHPDGTFRAGNYINAAELSKVLVNAFDLYVYDCNDWYFVDVSCGSWYGDYAYTAAIQYELFPYRKTYFSPDSYVTRGEMAYAINKLMTEY